MRAETQERANPETGVPLSGNAARGPDPPEDKRIIRHAAPGGRDKFFVPGAGAKLKEEIVKGPAVLFFMHQQQPAEGHFRAIGTIFFSGIFFDGFTDTVLRRMQVIARAPQQLRGGRGAGVCVCFYL